MSILHKDGIAIMPMHEQDLPTVYALNMSYEVCKGAGFWRDMPTYAAFCAWMHPYLGAVNKEKQHLVIVPDEYAFTFAAGAPQDRGAMVLGVVSALDMSDVHRTAEVAVRIRPDMQRKGYARTALQLLIWELFMIRGYRKVFARVYDDNVPSQKLFESLGFEREACLKQHEMHMGKYRDVYVYSLWECSTALSWADKNA